MYVLYYFYCENCTLNGIQPVSRCLTQYKQRKTKRMRGSCIWRGETPRIQIKPAGSTKYTDNDYQRLRNDYKRPEHVSKRLGNNYKVNKNKRLRHVYTTKGRWNTRPCPPQAWGLGAEPGNFLYITGYLDDFL